MRADRLLSILLLLQVNRRLTAGELAQRLEVSERTIHRDMEALSTAGIPVAAERGAGGGWFLIEAYQTNLTGLNPPEVQALFLTKPAPLLADLGLHQAAEAALIKLSAALPILSRREAEVARQRLYIDVAGWRPSEEDISCLPILQQAIWRERKLEISYQRANGMAVERLVDPLGLIAKGRIWYFIAAVEGSSSEGAEPIEGEARTYRVSRVRAARLTGQPCVRPKGFNLVAYWEESKAHFVANLPRYPVTVRVDPTILPRLQSAGHFVRVEQIGLPDAGGWIEVRLRFEIEAEACGYILGFGSQIEVVEPAALRAKVIHLAEGALALYTRRKPIPDSLSFPTDDTPRGRLQNLTIEFGQR